VSAGSQYIVTGYKDLLCLKTYDRVDIKKVADFLTIARTEQMERFPRRESGTNSVGIGRALNVKYYSTDRTAEFRIDDAMPT
jgi:hypothetical protein